MRLRTRPPLLTCLLTSGSTPVFPVAFSSKGKDAAERLREFQNELYRLELEERWGRRDVESAQDAQYVHLLEGAVHVSFAADHREQRFRSLQRRMEQICGRVQRLETGASVQGKRIPHEDAASTNARRQQAVCDSAARRNVQKPTAAQEQRLSSSPSSPSSSATPERTNTRGKQGGRQVRQQRAVRALLEVLQAR